MSAITASEWEDILGQIRVNHGDLARGWFAQLHPVSLQGGILRIQAGNPMQVRYLTDHCRAAFVEAAQTALGKLVTVDFESSDGAEEPVASAVPLSFERDGGLVLNKDYTFDEFVVGPENRLAHAAAVATAESPGRAYNPLFIHGDVGLGKTHLLQAICHATGALGSCPSRLYISCETFTNHFIEAVERGALHQFRFRYRHVDLLMIDDIQFLGESERTQEEFFHTFNTLHQARKQIVVSADCSPAEIPSLQDRLISRFNSGLVARIDRPSLETRMAIISKKAKLRCIEVPEEVVKFVALRFDTNIRDLEGALVKLDAVSQTRDGKIDLPLAQEALGRDWGARLITASDVIEEVTRRFAVRLSDLQSKKRTKSISHPRQVCMYIMREVTNHSLEEIGGWFGGRDHTTVLHASRAVKTQREKDPELDRAITEIMAALKHDRAEAH